MMLRTLVNRLFALVLLAGYSLWPAVSSAQVPAISASPQPMLTLQDLERAALEKHPTLAQVEANVRAARGRALQAGLYPNPSIGVTADEVSPGPIIRGGEFGVFVQQEIVLGGKLGKSRRAVEEDVRRAEALAEAQRLRVLTEVRRLYSAALAAQQRVDVQRQLMRLMGEAVITSRQLQNVGQADQPDVLEIEIDQELTDLKLAEAQSAQAQVWKQLAAAVGDVSLQLSPLAGDIEEIPEVNMETALTTLLRDSPEIKLAEIGTTRAEAVLDRARAEKIPNLDVRGGLRYNRELLEIGGRPVGTEGFFDVGVRIPIFDRNQGGVTAAESDLVAAQREIDRVRLSLRARFAAAYKEYLDSRNAAERYRSTMLPRAQRAYDLYMVSFRQMAAAYPQALIARRTLLQLQDEYAAVLAMAWAKAVEIQGLLLSGELDSRSATESSQSMRGVAK